MIPDQVSSPLLRATRWLVAASLLGAPLAHAWLLRVDGVPAWPVVLALLLGGAARACSSSAWPLAAALALGPVWQLGTGVLGGTADLQRLMPWLALIGAWLAWPPAAPASWRVSGAWRLGVVTWAVVLAAVWPVTALRELDFTGQTLGVATSNGSFGMTPHLSAAMAALTAQAQLVALLLCDWGWGAAEVDRRRAWLALAPGVALACALAVWQQLVDPAFLSTALWAGLSRAAGPFYDANAMGALAALGAGGLALPALRPAALAPAVWSGAWAALGFAGVVASGSRSALAALLACLATMALAYLQPRARRIALGVLLLVAVAVVAAARLAPPGDEPQGGPALGRLAGTLRRVASGGASELLLVAWRRDGYGPASLAVAADHPWVGVGPGMLGNVITDYAQEALGLRLPPDNAQNWWRQQLAELGGLGAAAPFLCSVLALVTLVQAWQRNDAPGRTAPLLALGLMGTMSPPTQHPVIQALAGLLVASAVAPRAPVSRATAASRHESLSGAIAWLLALTCAVGLGVAGWTSFRPAQRASRFHFLYYYGLSPAVETPFGGGRWSARRSVAVVPPQGSQMVVHLILPHEDLAASPVTVTVGDGTREVCRLEGRSHDKLECEMPVTPGRWPIVEIAVSRPWRTVDGVEQAALVAGRFDP